jgi:hypothetical protein
MPEVAILHIAVVHSVYCSTTDTSALQAHKRDSLQQKATCLHALLLASTVLYRWQDDFCLL